MAFCVMYKQSHWFIDHTCWCKQEGTRQLHLFRRPSSTWVLNDWLGCHFSLLLNFPRMNFQVCHNQCRRWEEKKRKRADIKVPGEDSTFKVGAARSTWQKHTEAEKGKQSEGFHHHPSPQKITFFYEEHAASLSSFKCGNWPMGRKKQRVRWNPVNPHDPDQATDMIQMETSTQPQVIVSSTEPVTEEATAASSGMRLALSRFFITPVAEKTRGTSFHAIITGKPHIFFN